jgi:alkylated DNA repair protein alkB family protein 6
MNNFYASLIIIRESIIQDRASWYDPKYLISIPVIDVQLKPHEDGPSYHPVVATISLGSHTVFHYYRYNDKDSLSVDPGSMGRSVDPAPLLSLFLEPRSVVITTGEFYTTHLHGIDEVDADTFTGDGFLLLPNGSYSQIVNRHMIQDETVVGIIESGGKVERTTRYSLTCRDVEKVVSGRVAGVVSRT